MFGDIMDLDAWYGPPPDDQLPDLCFGKHIEVSIYAGQVALFSLHEEVGDSLTLEQVDELIEWLKKAKELLER